MNKELRFNLLFWGAYFLYEWLGHATIEDEYWRYWVNALVIVPLAFAAAMFTVHFLLKRYFLKGKKRAFWWGFAGCVAVFALIRRTFNYFYTYPLYYPEGLKTMPYLFLPKIVIEAVNTCLIVGVYVMFYFVRAWYEEQRISASLKKDKAEAELELLKSQVQPHFIFNTLNNIYSLAQHGNPKTPDLIYRLSAFLSYSLYDSRQNTISVQQELDYIRHYIELEKIRYGEQLDISVNIFQPLDGFQISPMLFLPLVENAFKHGLADAEGNCWIRLDFTAQDDWLTLKIENSLPDFLPENGSKNGGIGLENVRRRLEILYPDRYEFRCLRETDSFMTILKIKTSPLPSQKGMGQLAYEN
ncbi:MAG: histidine kinase [Saprospiraceae bacterium]|nr:histidine kinase [Saprospiraceae bacterium]